MAKISAGILSNPRGKVAGVVGSTWKGQGYIREKVIPANPNTAAQQAQRSSMKNVVHFAQLILANILIPYVSPFQKHQSGYNWFVKQNIKLFTTEFPYSTAIKLTAGTLTPPAVEATLANKKIVCTSSVAANPAASGETLRLCALAVDTTNKKVYFTSSEYTGTSASLEIDIDDEVTGGDCLFFYFNALEKEGLKTRDVSTSQSADL